MWCMVELRKVVAPFVKHNDTNNPIELPFEKSFFNFVLEVPVRTDATFTRNI